MPEPSGVFQRPRPSRLYRRRISCAPGAAPIALSRYRPIAGWSCLFWKGALGEIAPAQFCTASAGNDDNLRGHSSPPSIFPNLLATLEPPQC